MSYDAVIFDLGQVVLGWDPTPAYAQVMAAEDVPEFLTRIDFHAWNRANDGGRSFDAGEAELIALHPEDVEAITAYRRHFSHALTGMIHGTSGIIAELGQAGVHLSGLTNWSAETYPIAFERFGILRRFAEIVVSGREGLLKPEPALFLLACERSGLDPAATVFVDDTERNVAGAEAAGLTGLHFTGADTLRADLERLGVLGPWRPIEQPAYHVTTRQLWQQAIEAGEYLGSTRDISYEKEGFVHCAFRHQIDHVVSYLYPDLGRAELAVIEVPSEPDLPIVVEDGLPHLFAPLPVDSATRHHLAH